MEPLVGVRLREPRGIYSPGDLLRCQYQIDAVNRNQLAAVEASVLWYTEGKGDEDMGVHFFERRTPADCPDHDLRCLHAFDTVLPNSPLSYHGVIVKIRWCARVRVFLKGGRECVAEKRFELACPAPEPVAAGA